MSCFIVAEIGLNHMGRKEYADYYLKQLCASHVNGVTFQVREPSFYAPGTSEAELMLSHEYYLAAGSILAQHGIAFGAALCDREELEFFETAGTEFYKILSKDIGNFELVRAVLATGKQVWVSTGLSDQDEVMRFVDAMGVAPNLQLIHTQLSYNDADTNLRAIAGLRSACGVPVGFGLHATDYRALYAAMAFCPSALFFYVKGHRYARHRDEEHAVPLAACADLVLSLQRTEMMLGTGIKEKVGNTIPDQQ